MHEYQYISIRSFELNSSKQNKQKNSFKFILLYAYSIDLAHDATSYKHYFINYEFQPSNETTHNAKQETKSLETIHDKYTLQDV